MKISILDDDHDTLRGLDCFAKLAGHDVTVWTDPTDDIDVLAERLIETGALVLIRERTKITAALLERLPRLRLISQRGVYPHIDIKACTRMGVVVCSDRSRPPLEMDTGLGAPGIGNLTREAYELQFSDIFDQILAYAAGAPINVVNPASLARAPLNPAPGSLPAGR